MKWIDKLEKRFGHLAIHNLALYLVIGQVFVFSLLYFGRMTTSILELNSTLVLHGQIWRLFSFMLIPPGTGILMAFAWYIFWMISQALEAQWGTFKYNLFLLIGVLATWLASLFIPLGFFNNYYIGISVFLAFATLYPNFEFLLFFILPVKVKYLAWISLGFLTLAFLQPPAVATRFEIIAALANYALFFGKDLYQAMYFRKRRIEHQKETKAYAEEAFHICATCGATDKSNPEREFRYKDGDGICSDCLEKETTPQV